MEEELALARRPAEEMAPPPPVEWERSPDPTVLRVSTAQAVTLEQVKSVLEPFAAEVGVEARFMAISGPQGLSNRFAVKFAGEPRTAIRRQQKVFAHLREPGGGWKQMLVDTPTGGACRVYVSEDQNLQQIRLAQATKKLATIVSGLMPGARCVPLRREGVVSVDWVKLVRVTVVPDGPPVLEWNAGEVDRLQLDRSAVAARLRSALLPAAAADDITWCS